VPWAPVGEGFLTGKIDTNTKFDPKTDFRSGFPRLSAAFLPKNMPIVDGPDIWKTQLELHVCARRAGTPSSNGTDQAPAGLAHTIWPTSPFSTGPGTAARAPR